MSKKLTLEIIKDRLRIINPNIEILSTEYLGDKGKLNCKCLIDDYEWETTWGGLQQKHGCPLCSGKIKLTLKEVKERLKIISPNIEILSQQYVNAKEKLNCKCLIDGYEWKADWSHLSQGQGCPECSGNARLTLELIKEKLKGINPNIEILSNSYKNNNTKLECKCLIDGHIWNPVWNSLLAGFGCPICGNEKKGESHKLTLSEIKEKLKEINPNIIILSNTYINSKTKMRCKCLLDDYEWEVTWSSLSQNGCPQCSNNRRDYTIDIIKEKLKVINPNVEILSEKYTVGKDKIKCKCLIDNCENIWQSSWRSLQRGCGCPKCGFKKSVFKRTYTLTEIKEKLKIINSNIKIMDDICLDVSAKLKCKCLMQDCGHEWYGSRGNLLHGQGCPKCANNIRFTLEKVKDKLKIINPNIEIISEKYKNNNTKLKCRCLIDGFIWKTSWQNLLQGKTCPKCSKLKFSESKKGELNVMWKGGVSEIQRYLRRRMKEWRFESMKKCNYKCVITGLRFNHVHHIYGFEKILQETFEITQLPIYEIINQYTDEELGLLEKTCLDLHYKYGLGVCLTKEIHDKFHNRYGRGQNTLEQWEEFKNLMLKEFSVGA